jgi:hypothetical protein
VLYVQAIDDGGARSVPARAYFNRSSIAPNTRITFPDLSHYLYLQLGAGFEVRWVTRDFDSPGPDQKAMASEYKVVSIEDSQDPGAADSLRNGTNLLVPAGDPDPRRWIRIPARGEAGEQLQLSAALPPSASYALGVRAVDETGAVEPNLERNRNYFGFTTTVDSPQPLVAVEETTAGTHTFGQQSDLWSISVPAERGLHFHWTGEAINGSYPGESKYALDIPDPDDDTIRDPNGIGGWTDWAFRDGNDLPFFFPSSEDGTVHRLYIYMRDLTGLDAATRKCEIELHVTAMHFDRFALVVDDARFDDSRMSDGQYDGFLHRTLLSRLYELGPVDSFIVFPSVNEGGYPQQIPLSLLSHYQHVFWSFGPHGTSSGLRQAANGPLATWHAGGGRLFLCGGWIAGTLAYPLREYPWSSDESTDGYAFYFRFMNFRDMIHSVETDGDCGADLSGMLAARSLDPAFPDLALDLSKRDPWERSSADTTRYIGGLTQWEGDKLRPGDDVPVRPGLDSLYAVATFNHSTDQFCDGRVSQADGAICGIRYESTPADTAQGTQHGKLIALDFEPWFFPEDLVRDVGTAAFEWLVGGRSQ